MNPPFHNIIGEKGREKILSPIKNANFAVVRSLDVLWILLTLASIPAGLLFGPTSPAAGLGIGASGLFLARWILWISGERARREARQLAQGEGLLDSWTVGPEDLEALVRAEGSRQGSEAQTGFFALTFAGLFVAVTGMIPVPWWAGLLMGVGLGLFGLALSAVHKKISLSHLRVSQGDVFIGHGGVMIAGVYTEWTSRGRRLTALRYDPEARLLFFTLENAGRHGKTTREVLVPVPPEKTEAAQALVQNFSAATGASASPGGEEE